MQLNCSGDDKKEIEEFLGVNTYLHIYSMGDLDERFRPYTQWHGLKKSEKLSAVICIYTSTDAPTVMALSEEITDITELLIETIPLLPDYFQAHLSPELIKVFTDSHNIEYRAAHFKMALLNSEKISDTDTVDVHRLGASDIPQLTDLYNDSYPGNWFEPEMLELNRYFGIKKKGRLISAAGTHVYSPAYRAAALGNIATLPEYRGQGLGAKVTAALSRYLLSEKMRVGLNVKIDNKAAISCYRSIGFQVCSEFGEYILRKK